MSEQETWNLVEMADNGTPWKEIADTFGISVDEALARYRSEVYDHWDTGWELGPADSQSRFQTGDIDVWHDGQASVQIEELHETVPLTLIAEEGPTRTLVQANLTAEQARSLAATLDECADILEGEK